MQVIINNQPASCDDGMELAAFLKVQSIDTERTAVAVNGEVVPRASWADCRLSEGDEILVIKATYGG